MDNHTYGRVLRCGDRAGNTTEPAAQSEEAWGVDGLKSANEGDETNRINHHKGYRTQSSILRVLIIVSNHQTSGRSQSHYVREGRLT